MVKLLILYHLFLTFQDAVFGISLFDFPKYGSHLNSRFLNSNYQHRGLGLFKPHYGESSLGRSFSEGKKGLNGDHFFVEQGIAKEGINHGDSGVYKGEGVLKDSKGQAEYFFDADGGNKKHVDGEDYYGEHHFDSEAKAGDEAATKQGHRKGHKVKGFSTSHHNDETGKTEEFYDEAHDEAGQETFEGKAGAFGESGKETLKGEHQDGVYKAGEVKKGVHFDKGTGVEEVRKDEKHFGEKKFGENGETFGAHKILGEGGLSEYAGSSKISKHHPSFYV